MQLFVQPATAFARCRYVDLPGVRSAAGAGPADVFLSHCWGAKWGTLVAAAASHLDSSCRVWIDLFAVRQWPGNGADLDFRGVIRRCKATLVVVEAIDRVGELKFSLASVGVSSLMDYEKKMLPFMRIWCLCESKLRDFGAQKEDGTKCFFVLISHFSFLFSALPYIRSNSPRDCCIAKPPRHMLRPRNPREEQGKC